MIEPTTEQKEFLAELSKLTRKHKIGIAGCGCCGSPFLTKQPDAHGAYELDENSGQLRFTRR